MLSFAENNYYVSMDLVKPMSPANQVDVGSMIDNYINMLHYLMAVAFIVMIAGMILGICRSVKSRKTEKGKIYENASIKWVIGYIMIITVVKLAIINYELHIIELDPLHTTFWEAIETVVGLSLFAVMLLCGIKFIKDSAKVLFFKNPPKGSYSDEKKNVQ